MNIIVRLYWQHDLDLVALCMHPDFDMGKWMKKAVVAFSKGDAGFKIPLPRSMPYRVELDNCSTHFGLTPGKDDDIIACMNGFRYGQRNSAIKNIFRMYLEAPYLDPYYNAETFAVKQRGSAKDADVIIAKKQVTPVIVPVSTSPVVEAVRKTVPVKKESIPVATKSIEPAVVQKEVKKEVPSEPSKEIIIDESTPISNDTNISFEGTDDSEDGFDLFGAIGEMLD